MNPIHLIVDPHKIKNSIKIVEAKGLKVKAIIPVDLIGLPANYNKIYDNCSDENLFIIEDAAQGFGGMINGKSWFLWDSWCNIIFPS